MPVRAPPKRPVVWRGEKRSGMPRHWPYCASKTPAASSARPKDRHKLPTSPPALPLPTNSSAGRKYRERSTPARSSGHAHTAGPFVRRSGIRHLSPDAVPDPSRGMPLLPGSFFVQFQNAVHEIHRCRKLPARPLHLLARGRQCAADRFPHHTPVHLQLLRHTGNGPGSKLILPADLLEKLHFRSPIQRVPPLRAAPEARVPVLLRGWAKSRLFRKFGDAHGARCSSWVAKGSTRR